MVIKSQDVAIAFAIRPEECLVQYDNIKRKQPCDDSESCRTWIYKVLNDLRSKQRKISKCVISTFGDVDSNTKVFLGSAVKASSKGDWRKKIDFKHELRDCIDGRRLHVFNDGTTSAYNVFQNCKGSVGEEPFLLILVRPWGIGFGLVYKSKPWTFGRNPELSHIPALPVKFPNFGDDIINLRTCSYHNDESGFPCVADLASGLAAEKRTEEKMRDRLQSYFGGAEQDAFQIEAFHLAFACAVGAAAYSPKKIGLTGEYLNENIVQQMKVFFKELTQDFPHRDSTFLQYFKAEKDVDLGGALLLARQIK